MTPPSVVIRPRFARPLFARHPWAFAGSIASVEGQEALRPGTEVRVVSDEGHFIGRGLYNPNSAIRARMYRWDDAPLDAGFWRARLDGALALRRNAMGWPQPGQAARLVFSEGDGLSGLTVDAYGEWLVAQFTSHALAEHRTAILNALQELTAPRGILVRSERSSAKLEGMAEFEETYQAVDVPEEAEIEENDLKFLVRLRGGQKTGFYLDQAPNRLAIARFARDRRVLDLFCHSGAFALTALQVGGARHVLGVDSSTKAIDLARRNAVLNGASSARFEPADSFELLGRLARSEERFDMVICDPPKYAPRKKDLDEAIGKYVKLNQAALGVLAPGGFLVTCSCSGQVDRPLFARMLAHVSERTGRTIQVLEQRGQAPDHPVSASCLESDYLKCFICRVS